MNFEVNRDDQFTNFVVLDSVWYQMQRIWFNVNGLMVIFSMTVKFVGKMLLEEFAMLSFNKRRADAFYTSKTVVDSTFGPTSRYKITEQAKLLPLCLN